jgi:hypothetical protein
MNFPRQVEDLFARCREKRIPLAIMSAGLTNVIEEILRQVHLLNSTYA